MILILTLKLKESGATAIEYALLIGSLALAIVGSLNLVESELSKSFNEIADEF